MKLGINCTELVTLSAVDRARVLGDIAAFGFRDVRCEVPMAVDWTALDNANIVANAMGITLLPVLGVHMTYGYTPATFAEFAKRVAILLHAPRYEIMNEPNLHLFNAYAKADPIVALVQRAGLAIKSVQSNAQIVFPGLAACVTSSWWQFWFRNASPEQFLTDSLKLGVGPFFDLLGYHPYSLTSGFIPEAPSKTQPMIARIDGLRKLAGRPVLLTEWGFDFNAVSPTVGAKWFQTQLPLMGDGSYLYGWRDYGQYKFGLVDANNMPRQPMYDTVKAALT